MWVLSQRAMRRVAMDLAAQQGVSEAEVVARAMRYANEVLNGDGRETWAAPSPRRNWRTLPGTGRICASSFGRGEAQRASAPRYGSSNSRKSCSASAPSIQALTPGSARTRCT
jgi:hypothetical protein